MRRWLFDESGISPFSYTWRAEGLRGERAIYAVKLKHVFACRDDDSAARSMAIGTAKQAGGAFRRL
jgi:hypothetical protein